MQQPIVWAIVDQYFCHHMTSPWMGNELISSMWLLHFRHHTYGLMGDINNHIQCVLTHWGRHKMTAIYQTTFSNAFCWMKTYEFRLIFHWIFLPMIELTIFQHWFRKWLGADQATSHYLNQCWLVIWRIYASLGLNELMCILSPNFTVVEVRTWPSNFYIP